MSRFEMYPWSLMTEVGDYFAVPTEFKPFSYVSQLVTQRNYRAGSRVKMTAVKVNYGTIVLVAQVLGELPPYEYKSPEGIMSISSKQRMRELLTSHGTPLGERAVAPIRTVSQIVNAMSWEAKNANLPWWYDPKSHALVFNARVATAEDTDKWFRKEPMPGKDEPYPEYYGLDENLTKKTRQQLMDEEPEEEDEFFELIDEGQPVLESESDTDDV